MFSTNPSAGMASFRNIVTPRLASSSAMSCMHESYDISISMHGFEHGTLSQIKAGTSQIAHAESYKVNMHGFGYGMCQQLRQECKEVECRGGPEVWIR